MLRKLFALICSVGALSGCTGKNPLLDSTPPPPQANTIQVSVYDGTVLQPGVGVYVRYPNGAVESAPTNSNGVAALSTSGTGVYSVGFSGQSAQSISEKQLSIVSGQTLYSVSLQLKGAAMAVQIPFGQSNGYAFSSSSKAWTLTYLNSSDFASDITLGVAASTPLPAGWILSFSQSFLAKGQSALLQLTIPQGSDGGNTTIRIEGRKSGGGLVVFGDLFLSQEWNVNVRLIGSIGTTNSGPGCPPNSVVFGYQGISVTVETTGIPTPAVFTITDLVASLTASCPSSGVFSQVWAPGYMGYGNTIHGIVLPSQASINVNSCSLNPGPSGNLAFNLNYGSWSKAFSIAIPAKPYPTGGCATYALPFNLYQ